MRGEETLTEAEASNQLEMVSVSRRRCVRGKHRRSQVLAVRSKQSYTPQHLLRASLCDRPEQQLAFLWMPGVTMTRCNEVLGPVTPGGRTGASGRPSQVWAKTQVQGSGHLEHSSRDDAG